MGLDIFRHIKVWVDFWSHFSSCQLEIQNIEMGSSVKTKYMKSQWLHIALLLTLSRCNFYINFYQDIAVRGTVLHLNLTRHVRMGLDVTLKMPLTRLIRLILKSERCKELPKLTLNITFTPLAEMIQSEQQLEQLKVYQLTLEIGAVKKSHQKNS